MRSPLSLGVGSAVIDDSFGCGHKWAGFDNKETHKPKGLRDPSDVSLSVARSSKGRAPNKRIALLQLEINWDDSRKTMAIPEKNEAPL